MRSCSIRGVIRHHLAWLVLILWSWRVAAAQDQQAPKTDPVEDSLSMGRMSSQAQRHSITTALGRLDLAAQPRLDVRPPH
uniref:Uncharacterized protein n=1 Tax=Oryza barthii TaxID=65489 RepID=A0A0D3G595_9ORYZ